MAQDFAKQRPSGRRSKGAARRQPPSAGTHWSWFFTGLMCGLFVAFVGYLGVLKPAPGQEGAAGEETAAAVAGQARGGFDFYQYLPEAEVQVDVVPVDVEGALAADAAADPPAASAAAAPTQVAVVQAEPAQADDVQYLLQAGSFQAREEADALRASIILMNMQANVVPGTVSGKTWHRVQVGPFTGRAAAEAARDTLTSNRIDTIVLRMK